MADKISMSQRALRKVMTQRYISSQRYIPNNVTLKKQTVCILRPVPAFGWAPVMTTARLHQWETLVPTRSQNLITYALLHWVDLEG